MVGGNLDVVGAGTHLYEKVFSQHPSNVRNVAERLLLTSSPG
jgi:hypothetical protein